MKCDELKSYTCGGWCCDKEAYPKKDVDKAIAELKSRIHELESMPHTDNSAVIELLSDELEKLRPMEAALEIAEADNKKYIERIKELEAENESLRKAVSNWHDKYCNLQETIDRLERKLECVKENKDKELRATKHALWLARAARAKTEYQHWILIWRCANTNQYFFINKTRYRHTSKVDRMMYPWEWRDIWSEVEQRCLKKAEEYK